MTEILYRTHGDHVAVITMNRPDKRNAVNGAFATALGDLVARTEADPAIRAVVLASSDPAIFCAGADLGEIARGNAKALWTSTGFAGISTAARAKPWIAAITGPALAGGCEIALCCDMIVASDKASFGLPEVKRGLFAAAGGAYRLPRTLPRNIALEMIATGEPLPAARAYALGLVNHLVATADVAIDTALALATKIAANAPVSVVESLKVARVAAEQCEADLIAMSRETTRMVMQTQDAREGPLAFVERRAPVWQGR